MRRRDFIALLSSAPVWSRAASAQQPERMRRIGVLESWNEGDPQQRLLTAAFVDGLQKLGWTTGTNVIIDYRASLTRPGGNITGFTLGEFSMGGLPR
jgi:putative tryptophan/tyrosine transport system substrate-binding protein